MADETGRLDGLRDIIHPSMPVSPDYSMLITLGLILLIAGVLYYLYHRYQQRRLYKARQVFVQLRNNKHQWSAHQCGESLVTILRLYTGSHNVRYQETYGLDKKQWAALLNRCNQLRFSDVVISEEQLTMPMAILEGILWRRH